MNSAYGVDPRDVLGLEQQTFQDNFHQQKSQEEAPQPQAVVSEAETQGKNIVVNQ